MPCGGALLSELQAVINIAGISQTSLNIVVIVNLLKVDNRPA
ncbi:hypothetical protein JCM19240_3519 [Vibrio maritimus]|uniref:Uncharacterized protein n=1 Tax=Vibrio maritimus TaxID=990268 RepID=A0A090T8S2_9VIBR|nr:hypothetical protein JCM19240_3519 [Vibrio maritimus]